MLQDIAANLSLALGPATSRGISVGISPKLTLFRFWNPAMLRGYGGGVANPRGRPESAVLSEKGDRLWRCECAAFQRRLEQYGEGFCVHTAVAIMRSLEDRSIEF